MDKLRIKCIEALNSIFRGDLKPKDALSINNVYETSRDRSFVMEIVYGVIRYRDYLDWLLGIFIRAIDELSDETLNNLRIALYQIIFMRVPDRASVFEAVEIEKTNKGKPSLVNAVLREYIRRRDNIKTSSIKDPVKRLAVETSHPYWLTKSWIERFGYKEARELAMKNNEKPPLTLRFRDTKDVKMAIDALTVDNIAHRLSQYCPNSVIVEDTVTYDYLSKAIGERFFIQDEASQLITYLLNPEPFMTVLDACSAPGGKTIHITEMMQDKGQIIAVDVSESRIRQLKSNIKDSGYSSIKVINTDILRLHHIEWIKPNYFDRILLDAPCSSIGVIRRNPDVKYRHKLVDLRRFKKKQLEMLEYLFNFLKPGGQMVYSVCSTERQEGEEVIKAFLQKKSNLCKIYNSFSKVIDFSIFYNTEEKDFVSYRTFPHRHNIDGFFSALIKKVS